MNELLPTLCRLRRSGVRIIVNTRNPDEHNNEHAAQAIRAITKLQDMEAMVLYTVRHHRKLAIMDNKIL